MNLQYAINSKEKLTVISLKGRLDDTASPVLQQCLAEALATSPNGTIVHIANIPDFPKTARRDFFIFYKELKKQSRHIRISGLTPENITAFVQNGLLSKAEICESLPEAVKTVAALIK